MGRGRHVKKTTGLDWRRYAPFALVVLLALGGLVWFLSRPRGEDVSASPAPSATPSPAPDAASEPTIEPTPEPTRSAGRARIRFLGDFVIHDAILDSKLVYDASSKTYDFTRCLELIADRIGNADYTVANVDGSMGSDDPKAYQGYPYFDTPPSLLTALKGAGVDMLTLSNNHILDKGYAALQRTIDNCEAAGLAFVGGARTREESETPVIVEIGGIRVGFLAYTDYINAAGRQAGAAALDYGVNQIQNHDLAAEVRALREAGAQAVVAYCHWGKEYTTALTANQKTYAQALAEAGADVIVGGHPHVIQPLTWLEAKQADGSLKRVLCLYSLGNFLANNDADKIERNSGIIFEFTLETDASGAAKVTDAGYIPTYIWRVGTIRSGATHRVVACADYLDAAGEGMDASLWKRLKKGWNNTTKLLGEDAARVLER